MKRILIVVALLGLAGCVSGYKQFYHPNPRATPAQIAVNRAGPPPVEPLLDHTGLSGDALVNAYSDQAYAVIGYSSFNGNDNQSDAGALKQAKEVGADLVVVANPAYTGTRSTVMPVVTPTTSTSYSTATATAYGSGGAVTAYGSEKTTTYGTQTSYVPVSTDRYDYLAVYFIKVKTRLGARVVDLSDAQRQEIQSNRGVAVIGVVKNSPAFDSDILVGDFILAVDGAPVADQTAYVEMLAKLADRQVTITIYRHGTRISKEVTLSTP